jgi:peroxiredoxin
MNIGDPAPSFELPDVHGATHAHDRTAPATVVVFTCNHCPYALAWHDRIADVARDYASEGVQVLAINPNDAERYPADSIDAMRERVANEDWPMPYLHDATQEVARAFGAQTTPDVFVLDRDGTLRYRGAPDPDHGDPSLNAQYVRDAVDAVLSGRDPQRPETKPVGCSVKWRQ